ncbi:S10 family peptidase [Caulobacter soli]|uniref:S10 family peptidase n=1 Tax=Caulobacter soli TaxID=2708539 RepID=UPI0013EA9FE6|nr:peptidase S10 [Caulobacter soli]
MKTATTCALAAVLLFTAPALAATPDAPSAPAAAAPVQQVAITKHKGVFNGQAVAYTATVADYVVAGADGKPGASIVTIAYTRDVKDAAKRPVMFVYNGGPGASSSPLHLGALGPMRKAAADAPKDAPPRDNPFSPLDAFDLVFIDPVGTGFSRPFPGADTKAWYSRSGDAKAVASAIEQWLKANKREASPRYMTGESYGTTRAAMILKEAPNLHFDGVALVALVGDAKGKEMPYVAALPTMAAGAWYHQRVDRKGRTVQQAYDEALEFARGDYVKALIQGSSLPPAEHRRIAERMSELTGLPVDLIESKDLRLSKNDFMFNLLKDKTLRTGLLDVRVTAPLEPGQEGSIDDPALGVMPKRAAGAPAVDNKSFNPASLGAIPNPALGRYLTEDLKFKSAEPYYALNFIVNSAWNYEGGGDVNDAVGEAMKADPKLRLFWAAGLYDLTTPAYAARYTLDHAGIPVDRLTAVYFDGPHGVYDGDDNLAKFNAALKAFVAAGQP